MVRSSIRREINIAFNCQLKQGHLLRLWCTAAPGRLFTMSSNAELGAFPAHEKLEAVFPQLGACFLIFCGSSCNAEYF